MLQNLPNPPRLIAIIGTRAQTIKMAPLLVELERRNEPYRLLLTGQHHETIDSLLDEFGVTTRRERVYAGPEVKGITQAGIWMLRTAWRLWLERSKWAPSPRGGNIVLAHGDTFTTLLAATVGRLVGCQIAHVEAGLRSFNWRHPFPEEITRVVVSRLAGIAYCPGAWACGNLNPRRVEVVDTGANTILDALRDAMAAPIRPEAKVGVPYAVVSVHRFENLQSRERMGVILDTIGELADRLRVILVLHPTTRKRLGELGELEHLNAHPGIDLRSRMTYVPFMQLLSRAKLVVSDGGSNQEELSYLGVPTLLMRMATERREGLDDNVVLSKFDASIIREMIASVGSQSDVPVSKIVSEQFPVDAIVCDLQRRISRTEHRVDEE
ncbi:hypothetical protein GM160_10500 [Guyparkeria halophila]|uniref:UDP-N-acetylglucosamine 2-epimerase domain-containing protein n=1 Tax=Guyparkeria halophila TaxID=47960 RepID=A0A6I6DBY9_9GAMM|nr:UDP-N-acetylglucosamine 2-epimerase [Guyparkeria halophila]QGT79282.1 hypothetical protein GM160_10500 [Guyparkeria halophila]